MKFNTSQVARMISYGRKEQFENMLQDLHDRGLDCLIPIVKKELKRYLVGKIPACAVARIWEEAK